MKRKFFSVFAVAALLSLAACSEDNSGEEPGGQEPGTEEPGGEGSVYPASAIVWGKDSTVVLTDHFVVPEGQSLYVEEGVTVVSNNTTVKPEIVVLGSMYCLGTRENPITFTVEEGSKGDRFSRNWGGIICGFNCPELYLNYVTIE